ncbi:uncharacterized protein LOC135075842 [Ostrinia nubilalis]|uniref:uncharacterized protein LOC114356700 n=1 Tax=Ostrinia furnacalis TaxID=93504 RepID=UPI0010387778|nr:uncharacterized protein LOC114356700 [Ostrinia furnacalis]
MEATRLSRQPSTEEAEVTDKKNNKIIELANTIRLAMRIEYGFGIFRFRQHDNQLAPINKKVKIFCIVLMITVVVLFSVFNIIPSDVATGYLVKIDKVPSIVILIQYVISAIRTSLFFNEGNIRIISTLADLDSKLHINTNQDFYRKSKRVTLKIVIILHLVHFIVSISDLFADNSNFRMKIGKLVILPIYLEQSLEISVFCLMVMMLTRRLSIINNYLLKFINEKDTNKASVFIVKEKKEVPEEFNLIGRSSSDNTKIRDLAAAYDIIGETCALVNEVFNFQIFMTLVATFTYVVITIWTGLDYYRSSSGENTGELATIIIWCFTEFCLIAFMSMTCEKLLLARTETKVLINKIIMDYDLPKTMRVQAKAFMELIEAWPLRIFIYDMFSVDITLMLKYISVSTTYLIVIIQISHFI